MEKVNVLEVNNVKIRNVSVKNSFRDMVEKRKSERKEKKFLLQQSRIY